MSHACYHGPRFAKKLEAIKAFDMMRHLKEINMSTNFSWVFDTGCGAHICIDLQELRNSRSLMKGEVDLQVGNGEELLH